jgi:hypothetical protein
MWIAGRLEPVIGNDGGANVSTAGRLDRPSYPTAQDTTCSDVAHSVSDLRRAAGQLDRACRARPAASDGTYYYDVGGGGSDYRARSADGTSITRAATAALTRYVGAPASATSTFGQTTRWATARRHPTLDGRLIIFSPVDEEDHLRLVTEHLETANAEQTWTKIDPNHPDTKTMGASGVITRTIPASDLRRGVLDCTHSQDINTIWAGSDDG